MRGKARMKDPASCDRIPGRVPQTLGAFQFHVRHGFPQGALDERFFRFAGVRLDAHHADLFERPLLSFGWARFGSASFEMLHEKERPTENAANRFGQRERN